MGRVERFGNATLYLGDMLELLPTLELFDAIVTDPPYGINVAVDMHKKSGKQYGRAAAPNNYYESHDWDKQPISKAVCDMLRKQAKCQIIFGGNYFELPPARCWLVWDKKNGAVEFADCELAWTNLDKPVRKFDHMWNGMLRAGGEDRNGHPTQKPLIVMEWCLTMLPNDTHTICDPFMGSGTTGVAALRAGKTFIGIEKHEPYFDIACRRVEAASKQDSLW